MAGEPVAVAHSVCQAVAHGQFLGRCCTSRRPVDAIRAGVLMTRLRRVAHRIFAAPAATPDARSMLNAITACDSQAAFAA